jgi:glycosyl transferase family 87
VIARAVEGAEAWITARVPLRPALAAVAVLSVVAGVAFVVVSAPFSWTADVHRNLTAARSLLDGTFGRVTDYFYSPLAAALTIPALAVPEAWAVGGWLALKIAILLAGTAWATRGLETVDRLLAAVAVVGFLPIVHDLELGNVTVIVVAAVALVAWRSDAATAGLLLGLVLATAPKPGLVPVLVWMLLQRPKALLGAGVTAVVGLLATWLAVGPAPFAAWWDALRSSPNLVAGNFALSGLSPVIAAASSVAVVGLTIVALRRGPVPGLIAAIACGLLVSPYTVLYAAGLFLVVAPAAALAAPRATLALALLAPIGLVTLFPVWVAATIVVALVVDAGRWRAAGPSAEPIPRPIARLVP